MSWHLQSSLPTHPRGGRGSAGWRGSIISDVRIEEVYFLPGDWASTDEGELCAMISDGTLLCLRNGEVAAVCSATLRKWMRTEGKPGGS